MCSQSAGLLDDFGLGVPRPPNEHQSLGEIGKTVAGDDPYISIRTISPAYDLDEQRGRRVIRLGNSEHAQSVGSFSG